MNDPGSAILAPPPRYLLESDSSDEEGQGEYAASSSRRITQIRTAPQVKLDYGSKSAPSGIHDVVIGIGLTGRYLKRKSCGKGEAVLRVLVDEEEVGSGWIVDESFLLVLEDHEGEVAWKVAEKVMESLKDVKWTIVTAYVPAMYIPDPDNKARQGPDAPIRHFDSGKAKLEGNVATWDSPNYLTGLAGAFVSMAAHPVSSLKSESLSTLLLPLPLSGLNTSDFISSLSTIPSSLSRTVSSRQKSNVKESRWGEADDEPYSATGMGGGRKPIPKVLGKEEISSMYM